MNSNQSSFTIYLKVAGQDLPLVISANDSVIDIFQRIRYRYPQCIQKKTQIISKLIDSLKLQLCKKRLNPDLLSYIEVFLSNSTSSNNISQITPSLLSNKQKSNKHRKPLQERKSYTDKENEEQPKSPLKKNSCIFSKQNDLAIKSKKMSIPCRLQKQTNCPQNKVKNIINSSVKKAKCNPDLIKACQIIMKKNQNNEMKHMAKQFLKEKGYLKQEKEKQINHHRKSNRAETEKVKVIQRSLTQTSAKKQQSLQQKTGKRIQTQLTEVSFLRQNNRYNKYRYLQSSMANETLKEYSAKDAQIMKEGEAKVKKYSYLQ